MHSPRPDEEDTSGPDGNVPLEGGPLRNRRARRIAARRERLEERAAQRKEAATYADMRRAAAAARRLREGRALVDAAATRPDNFGPGRLP